MNAFLVATNSRIAASFSHCCDVAYQDVALGGAGRTASKRLSDQWMVFDASLGLRGFSSAADGKIEPHFGEAQQPAFLDDRRGLPRTFDDLGGREPISFFVAHVLTSPIDMMV
jgi:hypothetical protein